MDRLELSAEKRQVIGKRVKHLRRENWVPAVVFGKAIESIPIQLPEKALRAVLSVSGGNRLISLHIKGQRKPIIALAREVQRDVLTSNIKHVDFQAVVMTEKIRTSVGLSFVNESPIVASGAAMLLHNLDSVEIECLPADLISSIEVDLSRLEKIDDSIYVSDLEVPSAVAILTHPEELVVRAVHMVEIAEEEEEEEILEQEEEEVEVIRRGRAPGEEVEEQEEG